MKTGRRRPSFCSRTPLRARAIMLMEALVYMAVFFVITSVAFTAFYRVMDSSKHLRRNTGEISQVLAAGERWREEVRRATGPITLREGGGLTALHIPSPGVGKVTYCLMGDKLMRLQETPERLTKALGGIKASRFIEDRRTHVTAWRWELELISPLQSVQVRPLFSFQAAARPAESKP